MGSAISSGNVTVGSGSVNATIAQTGIALSKAQSTITSATTTTVLTVAVGHAYRIFNILGSRHYGTGSVDITLAGSVVATFDYGTDVSFNPNYYTLAAGETITAVTPSADRTVICVIYQDVTL